MKQLEQVLAKLADREHYLFAAADFYGALPGYTGWPVLLSRAVKTGLLKRVCRGLYLYPRVDYPRGSLLFHAAARLRADTFMYISLESALCDAGVISQIPINTITLISAGRSTMIPCGEFGRIEFVHAARHPNEVAEQLSYDTECHLWRASVALALRDLRATRRSVELVDWEVVHELV